MYVHSCIAYYTHIPVHVCQYLYVALDLVFAEGLLSQWNAEFITIPLLDGGCEKSVNSENKVFKFVSKLTT